MSFWRDFFVEDLRIAFGQLYLADLAPLLQLGLWALVLFVPLSGIFRNDGMTAMTYMLFLAASATILLFAIPNWSPDWSDWRFHFTVLGIISVIGYLRWYIQPWRRHRKELLRSRQTPETEVEVS